MKNRYIVIKDQTAKRQDGSRNVIYDTVEKKVIFKEKTKNKDDRYWYSKEKALAVIEKLDSGEVSVVHNIKHDFYHIG